MRTPLLFAALITAAAVVLPAGDNLLAQSKWQLWGTGDIPHSEFTTVMTVNPDGSLKIVDRWENASPYIVNFFHREQPARSYIFTFKVQGKAGQVFRAGYQYGVMEGKNYRYLGSTGKDFTLKSDQPETIEIKTANIPAGATRINTYIGAAVYSPKSATGEITVSDLKVSEQK